MVAVDMKYIKSESLTTGAIRISSINRARATGIKIIMMYCNHIGGIHNCRYIAFTRFFTAIKKRQKTKQFGVMESKWKNNYASINNKRTYLLLLHHFYQWLLWEYLQHLQQPHSIPIN